MFYYLWLKKNKLSFIPPIKYMNRKFSENIKRVVVPNFEAIKLWKEILRAVNKLERNERFFYHDYARNV